MVVADGIVLSIAQVVPDTDAEGPGRRFAVWFQGCPLRCPGCCNPEFLPFRGGTPTALSELCDQLASTEGVEGITLLGGEPFAHAEGAAAFARFARGRGLSVMVFSGYTLSQLREMPKADALRTLTDVLVDGPYLRDRPDTTRRWVGSTNQEVHFLTDRYRLDERWSKRNTLEIRVRPGQISVNGFPAAGALELWKGWSRKP